MTLADARILVVYATRHGSTEGVARRISARLRERGASVDVRRVDDVDHIAAYDAVVVGSPVYNQRWLPEADRFVQEHASSLTGRQVWMFSVGSFSDTKRLIGGLMRREPSNIAELSALVKPRDYRVFAGRIERDQWPLPSRLFYRMFGGRMGDNRDWDLIDNWASGIGRELEAQIALAHS